ncbi:MAG: glycerol dehydratase reactivase beta/small subunit family protein [Desulfoferrobacter sp.]
MRDRNSRQLQPDKPAVLILSDGAVEEELVNPILWGLEEEGIPSEFRETVAQNGESISKKAAEQSLLGVGIGINERGSSISLHHRDLLDEKPLFILSGEDRFSEQLRILGTNAARLVKGEPLVFYDQSAGCGKNGSSNPSQQVQLEQLAKLIAAVVLELLPVFPFAAESP